ncbi:MAG: DinB family protein [Thermomicrobiales bacterium]
MIATRDELVDDMIARWDAFVAYVDSLPDATWISMIDAAGWTIKDHVSHVTQWDVAIIRLFTDGIPMQHSLGIPDCEWHIDYGAINDRIRLRNLCDPVPRVNTERDAVWTDLHRFRKRIRNLCDPVPRVKTERDAVWTDLLATVRSLTDDQLASKAVDQGINVDADDDSSLLSVLVENQGGHYSAHLEYIRRIANPEGTQ